MAIWSSEIKELEKVYESFKGHLPDLEKELERLIKADDENMVLLYSRRCLEVIITDLCECELKRPRKTEPLKGIIDKLHKEEKVPSHIIASMHGLNELSTYGAHPKDFDPEQAKPVDDNIFTIYKNQFLYDKTDMNWKVEEKDTSNDDWTTEKITFNSAYGKERVIGYLFLPKNSSPPFQTLIFFPGRGATWERDPIKSTETRWMIDYILKSGRAVMCPVYKGTFDRIDEQEPVVLEGHQAMEWFTKWTKDFSRSIDYLETRSDIDSSRIGYYGISLGGFMGGIIPAVDDRLKVNILILAGLKGDGTMVSYVSRIKIPTLMLNGKYDYTYPLEKSVKPFYDLISTTKKELFLYETDHFVPKNEMIKEVLAWCDKYLGPVKFKNQ